MIKSNISETFSEHKHDPLANKQTQLKYYRNQRISQAMDVDS